MPDCSDSTYTYIDTTYTSHNALADVHLLQQLASLFISNDCIVKCFTLSWLEEYDDFLDKKRENLTSLQPLIQAKVNIKGMAEKVASSGLTIAHLQLAYQKGAADGISNVLMERFQGKPRVTRNKRVAANICNLSPN